MAGKSGAITCSTGGQGSKVSFQHVIVPLLRILTQLNIISSMLTQFVLPIYAVSYGRLAFSPVVKYRLNSAYCRDIALLAHSTICAMLQPKKCNHLTRPERPLRTAVCCFQSASS